MASWLQRGRAGRRGKTAPLRLCVRTRNQASTGPRRKARKNGLYCYSSSEKDLSLQRGRAGRRGKTLGPLSLASAPMQLQRGRAGRRGKTLCQTSRHPLHLSGFNGAAPEGAEKQCGSALAGWSWSKLQRGRAGRRGKTLMYSFVLFSALCFNGAAPEG